MEIIRSAIFSNYPEIIFGFSTKSGLDRQAPYYFNLSLSVGDDENIVRENRREFIKALGLLPENVVTQKQVHSDIVRRVEMPGPPQESDAMITGRAGLGLAVSVADCTPIFIYDKSGKVIAGVHSGWRGTEKKILLKTLGRLNEEFNCNAEDLVAFIGPSICGKNYEVGEEVAALFNDEFITRENEKYFLDVAAANYKMLLDFGLKEDQIEMSELCTFAEEKLHSYRRDGKISGRSFGIIAMKDC